VIDEIEREVEEASATLGASRRTPCATSSCRCCPRRADRLCPVAGPGGRRIRQVIFIAGNMPMKTEIAPLLIVIKLEEFNYDGATAIGIAMLLISFALLLAINLIQVWSRRRIGYV
jgi:sulfate transport system permease protein